MKKEEVVALVIDLLQEKTGIAPEQLTENASLHNELSIDSLDIVEVVLELEKKFNIKVEDEDAERISSVGDLINMVLSKLDIDH